GKVCGEDTFVGGPNLDLSSQITRLRGKVKGCDAIFDGSWQPFGSQVIRAIRDAGINIPITTNASVNGTLITQVAGKVSNFYAEGFACLPTYCAGTQTPQVRTIAQQFKTTYHTPLGNHYALPGYALADAIVGAIKAAGSTDGTKLANALFGGKVTINYFGNKMKFTQKCHRPQPAAYSIEQGQIMGLIGPNGAGKTTFMNAVSSFVPLTGGRVVLDGVDVTGAPPHRLVDSGLVRTFQDVATFPGLTVFENVELGALGAGL